jgi:mannosyltransferase
MKTCKVSTSLHKLPFIEFGPTYLACTYKECAEISSERFWTLVENEEKRKMKGTLSKSELNYRSILLPAILLLGLFFRLYKLGGESLWLDEALSIKYAHLNLSQIIIQQRETPPLYYIVLHWWIHFFGISEFSLRFPSAMFGCLSVFMMYKTGKELFDGNTGKVSALLIAFSVFHVQYSQEARTYSLSVCLTLLSMYFFIKLLDKMNYRILFGYMLSSILLIYSHVYGLFIIIAQNIYYIVLSLSTRERGKPNVKEWVAIQCLLMFFFSPWIYIFLLKVYSIQKYGYWIETPHISTIISSFMSYSSGSILLLLLFLVLAIFSLLSHEDLGGSMDSRGSLTFLKSYQWKLRLTNVDKMYLLLIWLITPIVLPFIISRFSQPIYQNKYTIIASSAFFLLVARGVNNVRTKYVRSSIIGIVIILSLIHIRAYYSNINKEQWREAAEYIDTNARKGDVVLFNAPNCIEPFNYYSRSGSIMKEGFPEKGRKVDEENITKLSETVRHHDRIWVVLSHSGDNKGLIVQTLIMSYDLSQQRKYKDIELYLFDKGYISTASGLTKRGTRER